VLEDALELLRELRRRGAHVELGEGTLRVTAPAGMLTEELTNRISAQKQAVMQLVAGAVDLLNTRGVRLVRQKDRLVVGIWRDADGREVREALDVVGLGHIEVHHLEDPGSDIPYRYRQFVPEYVKQIWAEKGLPATASERLEAEAKARYLNRMTDTLGSMPRPSRITGATPVLHGMLARRKQTRP
jgi:hypothetical protein